MVYVVLYTLVILMVAHGMSEAALTNKWDECFCQFEEWQPWNTCNTPCFGQRVRERSVTFDDIEGCSTSTDCATEDERFDIGSCNTVCQNAGVPTGNLTTPCTCAAGYYDSCCSERVDCGDVDEIPYGKVTVDPGTDYGSSATYTCDNLYNLTNGDVVRVCENNFTWSGVQPQCISVDHCSSMPCENGATCVDLIGNFQCDCAQGWTGPQCEQDVQAPIVEGCPDDVTLNTTTKTIAYTLTVPMFTDPMGEELIITSNYLSPSSNFPWGDNTVQYTATKTLNGQQSHCTFRVKVRPTPCEELNIPINGARLCNGWRTDYGRFCMTACLQYYTLGPPYSFRTWHVCGASGTWTSSGPMPDCILPVYSAEDASIYQPEFSTHTFASSCEEPATKSALQELYIEKLKNHNGFSSFCTKYIDDCVPENVNVTCIIFP